MFPENIAILVGGPSAEAEVSRTSGAAVAEAIQGSYPKVTVFELDEQLTLNLQTFKPDVVLPVLHGPPGEDGTVQGYLEILGYPYTGSGVSASARAMDKITAKQLFRLMKLPVVPDLHLYKSQINEKTNWQALQADIRKTLGDQIVIKPACQGSALGTARIHIRDLQAALDKSLAYGEKVLVEQRFYGREITVGILENGETIEPLPVTEIVTPEGSWYDYQHRYEEGAAGHLIPAELPATVATQLQEIALAAHRVLQCRDLSRADFIVTESNEIYLLEVNTLPGMTSTSLYPDAAGVAGYSLTRLIQIWVDNAWRRRTLSA